MFILNTENSRWQASRILCQEDMRQGAEFVFSWSNFQILGPESFRFFSLRVALLETPPKRPDTPNYTTIVSRNTIDNF